MYDKIIFNFLNYFKLCRVLKKKLMVLPKLKKTQYILYLFIEFNIIKFFKEHNNIIIVFLNVNKLNKTWVLKNVVIFKKYKCSIKKKLLKKLISGVYIYNVNNSIKISLREIESKGKILGKLIV